MLTFLEITICLLILIMASNLMLNASIALAKRLKISPLVIGSTIVAFGTILPTMAVTIVILLADRSNIDIAVGNMIGTNYVNLGLALGIPAALTALSFRYQVIEKEILLYLAMSGLLTVFANDRLFSRAEGLFTLIIYAFAAFIIYQYARREKREIIKKEQFIGENGIYDLDARFIIAVMIKFIAGLLVLCLSAVALNVLGPRLAEELGISEYIIGLTVIGIGTSLPTIVTSIQAVRKGYLDVIFGNVFGGTIINIGLGASIPMLLSPLSLSPEIMEDIYFTNIYNIVIVIAILIEVKLLGDNKVLNKVSGVIIVGMYLVYMITKLC